VEEGSAPDISKMSQAIEAGSREVWDVLSKWYECCQE